MEKSPSRQINDIIGAEIGWKQDTLSQIRSAILATDSNIVEEVKWKMPSLPEGRPVWSSGSMLCFIEIWKDNIKLLFMKGAHMEHQHLFNARLKSADVRAIEFREGDHVNADIIATLIHEAIQLNQK